MARTVTYTVYSEAGGVGKTTLTANLAAAHVRWGLDVLAIDLDQQEGSLSYLLDVDEARAEGEADNLVRHLVGRPKGDLEDLIETSEEGIDVIPSHHMLEDLDDYLDQAEENGVIDDQISRLQAVLANADIPSAYDVIIVDPPATAGPHLYNAIYATRSLALPLELSGKGQQSVEGLSQLVDGLEETAGIEVGVLAVVPNAAKNTSDQDSYREGVRDLGFAAPIVIPERRSLMDGCWDKQCSAFRYVEEHRSRKRDYEMETLGEIEDLAEFLVDEVRGGS